MNDYEAMCPPKAYKRLIAIVVDIIVCFSFFAFFQLVCMPFINNTFHYNDLVIAHQENLVKYDLGRYDVNEAGETFFIEYTVGDGENAIAKEKYESAKILFEQDSTATEIAQRMNMVSLVSMSFLLLLAIIPNYLLFPLIHKNGQTLGKWLMRIAIVNKNGYEITYPRLLFRTLVGLYLCEILISYLFYTMLGIPLVLCISGLIAIFSESKNSIADYISGTSQIDKEVSIIG